MKTVHVDFPEVTRDEAIELCCYHLRMAAAYYEATPDDKNAQLHEELERVCMVKGPPGSEDTRALVPARAWLDSIWNYYEGLKKDDL